MTFGLDKNTIDAIIGCLSSNTHIKEAILYGSRAKGNFKNGSDIDLVLKGQNLSLNDVFQLENQLDDLWLPYKFDIAIFHHIDNAELIDHIKRVGISVYIADPSVNTWKECKLGDVITFQRGHDLPKTVMIDGSYPVAGSNGIIGFHHKFTTKAPGITIGRSGNIGTPHFYKKDFWAHNTVLFVKDFKGNNEKFVYYFLKTLDFTQFNTGSAVPSLNRNHIHELDVQVAPPPEQKAIAAVLSSLDDKIDLLHRQNTTLEGLAETLFRQWFVEEAKEEWEVISLYDAIELVGGGTPKTTVSDYWNGDIKWLSGGDIANNHKNIIVNSDKTITEQGLKNCSAKLLPQFSTVISARGTVGKYCILSEPMTFSQSNYGIKPKYKDCYFFTYLLINYSVEELLSAAYGAVFDTITTDTFKGHSVVLPKLPIIEKFEAKVKPYFMKILNNQTQLRTLTTLRDTLLPKLMSGEISVKI